MQLFVYPRQVSTAPTYKENSGIRSITQEDGHAVLWVMRPPQLLAQHQPRGAATSTQPVSSSPQQPQQDPAVVSVNYELDASLVSRLQVPDLDAKIESETGRQKVGA